ncbi:hypothetical protein NDU88_006109 [Pleurodeles waltl]|uniref:Uncharacterized protein n=1 Tax=Pleurodeles waltl TaxID=8319 RepID=A0AAV7WDB6_PLEWA|nr:hypothetical protein NDU88_006109 [Pleurodeles waltl]
MTWDGGLKARTVAKHTKGAKSKLLTPALGSNAKEPPIATAGGSLKEKGPKSTILPEEETATNITVPPTNAAAVVSSRSRILNTTRENRATNTLLSTSTLQNPLITMNTEGTTNITATMEELMGQILVELRAIKVSQEETRRETKEQLNQLNTHLTLLSTRVSQVEQRVSDLEDTNNQVETTTSRVQFELEYLQNKLDEMENRSQRSNLRFVGAYRRRWKLAHL